MMNKNLNVVYQGVKGAFSYLAGREQFGASAHCVGLRTFAELFESVENGSAHVAVIPYENSLIGTIYENCDLLSRSHLKILAERYLRIEHSLLALPEVREIAQISNVLSHIKALDQCRRFFGDYPGISPIVYEDTAGAAMEIAARQQPEYGAIAHEACASLYGLQVLKRNIQDHVHNYTRFIFVGKEHARLDLAASETENKTTVSFVLKNRPKELYQLLGLVAHKNVNMTKIESRPILGVPFEYRFTLDLVWKPEENSLSDIAQLLTEMRKQTEQFHCFGLYQQGQLWEK
jgi:prephenate dehydratase